MNVSLPSVNSSDLQERFSTWLLPVKRGQSFLKLTFIAIKYIYIYIYTHESREKEEAHCKYLEAYYKNSSSSCVCHCIESICREALDRLFGQKYIFFFLSRSIHFYTTVILVGRSFYQSSLPEFESWRCDFSRSKSPSSRKSSGFWQGKPARKTSRTEGGSDGECRQGARDERGFPPESHGESFSLFRFPR